MRTLDLLATGLLALVGVDASRASDGAAGPDQSICATAAVLAADPLAAGETGTWSVSSGSGTFVNAQAPQTQVTGLSFGENVFRWTIVGDGPPVIDEVVITVYDPAATVAEAGQDTVLCLPVDTMHLYAVPAIAPAIGSWASVGIALVDVPTDPHAAVEFPAGGTVQMIWTVYNGTCGQVSDTVIISVQTCVIGIDGSPERPRSGLLFDPLTRTLRILESGFRGGVEVFDQSGRRVISERVAGADERIPLAGLREGVYTARLAGIPGVEALRFVVQP